MPTTNHDFIATLRARHSARKFLPETIPPAEIRAILDDARTAPSNSNTQPWQVHLVSGATRDALAEQLVAAFEEGHRSPDFTDDYGDGVHAKRSRDFAALHYGVRGIARADHESRHRVLLDNMHFYGAPHVALLFTPLIGDGVRAAGDVGMYAQNFLLSLTARGYSGVPQTMIGGYADTVRAALGVPNDLKLLFAISFGVPDEQSPLRNLDTPRLPLEESVTTYDTPGVLTEPTSPGEVRA
jgi:nitroreductase